MIFGYYNNHVVIEGVCVTHGAKARAKTLLQPRGMSEGIFKGGVCWTHGTKTVVERKRCSFEGCTKYAQKGGVCVTHGAKLKQCSHEGRIFASHTAQWLNDAALKGAPSKHGREVYHVVLRTMLADPMNRYTYSVKKIQYFSNMYLIIQ